MPEKRTIEKVRKDRRAGKLPSTQTGEFVREEIRKIRRDEHGARSHHVNRAAARRSPRERSAPAQKAVRTKAFVVLSAASLRAMWTEGATGSAAAGINAKQQK